MGKMGRRFTDKRKQLSLILNQNCRCAYCSRPLLGLPLEWDHLTPYSYKKLTKDNWVASCKDCNARKHSKMFDEESLSVFISERITEYGELNDETPEGHAEFWIRSYGLKPLQSKINPPIKDSEEYLD